MRIVVFVMMLAALVHAEDGSSHHVSVGLNGAQALLGNYGLTIAVKLFSHGELTFPFEFYSFEHSLPALVGRRIASTLAPQWSRKIPEFSMYHARAGLGLRFFFTPSALDSGFFFEPIVYGGWLKHSDFRAYEFDDQRQLIHSVARAMYKKLPSDQHFALTPQLNLGYQWISQSGFLFQLALFANYVYAPLADTIFDASDRYFASNTINQSARPQWGKDAVNAFRAFATQMSGWHAGGMINFGWAF